MSLNFCKCIGVVLAALCSTAHATTFSFNTDPFAGTNVLNTPGRQIVGGEDFISFSTSNDVFSLDTTVFGTRTTVNFVNETAPIIPPNNVDVVVLETFDNDNNPLTPFGAGNAADLIAGRITTSGPGFFIYFNQSLDLPRLVYSTDLSSSNADLKILARMLNLNGQAGRDALPFFSAANFEFTTSASTAPEPASLSMMGMAGIAACCYLLRRKRTRT
jgi:PEP-CTERM motif